MSVAFNGEYSVDIFNAMKRYQMQFQKGVALADSELRELNDNCYSLTRQLVSNNFSTGSTTNDGFKVEESTTNTNNFLIKGGDGTVNGAGVLFVDGYILFLRNDIEYNEQDNTGALTDDDYTETAISALTTPGAPRTDEVYVDMYFAESSGDAGSEYQDNDLFVAGVGSATANRVRQVQDIRVAEGGSVPASGTDGNGIYHWRIKIATLNRLSGNATITNAMITDDRTIITSIGDLSDFNPEQIFFGGPTGTIDQDSLFVRDAATGNVGIGTDNPLTNVDILGAAATELTVRAPAASDAKISIRNVNVTKSYLYRPANSDDFRIAVTAGGDAISVKESNAHVGFGTTNPAARVHIKDGAGGEQLLISRGTGTVRFSQNTNTDDLMLTDSAGTDVFMKWNSTGVGIGTATPQAELHVFGDIVGKNDDTSNLGSTARRWANLYMASTIDYAGNLYFNSSGTKVTFLTSGSVGIGSTIPSKLFDIAGKTTIDASGNIITAGNLDVNGTTTTLNTETTTTDMLTVEQDDNQNALLVKQTDGANTATVVVVQNSGKGPAATFVGIGTGVAHVGIGTADPLGVILNINENVADGDVPVRITNSHYTPASTNETCSLEFTHVNVPGASVKSFRELDFSNAANRSAGLSFNVKSLNTMYEAMRITSNRNVGIGTTNPQEDLHVWGTTTLSRGHVGNLGIGTTQALALLDVNDDVADGDLNARITNRHYTPASTNETCSLEFTHVNVPAASVKSFRELDFSTSANRSAGLSFNVKAINTMYEAMRIVSNRNVGIGTTNPLTKLDVYGSSIASRSSTNPYIGAARDGGGAATLAVSNGSGSWGWGAYTAAGDGIIQGFAGYKLHVGVGTTSTGAPTMTFAPSTNNVGIGTTSPTTTLHVFDTSNAIINLQGSDTAAVVNGLQIRGGTSIVASFLHTQAGNTKIVATNDLELNPSGGNVGIGTDPTATLHVYDTSNAIVNLQGSDTASVVNGYHIRGGTALVASFTHTQAGNTKIAATNGLELNPSNGNVGIGTDPTTTFHAYDSGNAIIAAQGSSGGGSVNGYHIRGGTALVASFLHTQGGNTKIAATGDLELNPSGGNVGIGTDPTATLHVYDTSNAIVNLQGSDTASVVNGYHIRGGTALVASFTHTQAGNTKIAATNGLELNPSGGNVGINTAPDSGVELHVAASDHANVWIQGGTSAGNIAGVWFMHGADSGGYISSPKGNNLIFAGAGGTAFTVHPTFVSSSYHMGFGTVPTQYRKFDMYSNTENVSNIWSVAAHQNSKGVYGAGDHSTSVGVHGKSSAGIAIYGETTTGLAGYMSGKFEVTGRVGIGTTAPSYQQVYSFDSSSGDSPAVHGEHDTTSGEGIGLHGTGGYIGIYGEAVTGGAVADFYAGGLGNYLPFTGAHETSTPQSFGTFEEGMIVSSTGNVLKKGISTTLPEIMLSNTANDKTVLGIITNNHVLKDKEKEKWPDLDPNSKIASINALGEGLMLVTNYNGDIENGDYVTTSLIEGYGMKQDDDLLHNYTVAKLTEDIDWDSVVDTIDYLGIPYKKVLASVTYHCG